MKLVCTVLLAMLLQQWASAGTMASSEHHRLLSSLVHPRDISDEHARGAVRRLIEHNVLRKEGDFRNLMRRDTTGEAHHGKRKKKNKPADRHHRKPHDKKRRKRKKAKEDASGMSGATAENESRAERPMPKILLDPNKEYDETSDYEASGAAANGAAEEDNAPHGDNETMEKVTVKVEVPEGEAEGEIEIDVVIDQPTMRQVGDDDEAQGDDAYDDDDYDDDWDGDDNYDDDGDGSYDDDAIGEGTTEDAVDDDTTTDDATGGAVDDDTTTDDATGDNVDDDTTNDGVGDDSTTEDRTENTTEGATDDDVDDDTTAGDEATTGDGIKTDVETGEAEADEDNSIGAPQDGDDLISDGNDATTRPIQNDALRNYDADDMDDDVPDVYTGDDPDAYPNDDPDADPGDDPDAYTGDDLSGGDDGDGDDMPRLTLMAFQDARTRGSPVLVNPSNANPFAPGTVYQYFDAAIQDATNIDNATPFGRVHGSCIRIDPYPQTTMMYMGKSYCQFLYEFFDPGADDLIAVASISAEGTVQNDLMSRLTVTSGTGELLGVTGMVELLPIMLDFTSMPPSLAMNITDFLGGVDGYALEVTLFLDPVVLKLLW